MSSGGPGLPLCTCVSAAALRSQVLARSCTHLSIHPSFGWFLMYRNVHGWRGAGIPLGRLRILENRPRPRRQHSDQETSPAVQNPLSSVSFFLSVSGDRALTTSHVMKCFALRRTLRLSREGLIWRA